MATYEKAYPSRREILGAYRAERQMVVELVESMTDQEWDMPSLSAGWSIGEVAAHLTIGDGLPWSTGFSSVLRLSTVRGAERVQRKWAKRGRGFVLERLRCETASIVVRLAWGKWRLLSLAEIVIHAEDIRRPLEKPRPQLFNRDLAFPIIGVMGSRLREVNASGVLALQVDGESPVLLAVSPERRPRRLTEGAPDAVIKGSAIDLILRLSGRPANLEVEGAGAFAGAVREFCNSHSSRSRTAFWR